MTDQRTKRRFLFLPLTVRLGTVGGVATPLVLRGTPLPAKRSDVFSTAADNQSSVEADLSLGESALTQNNLKLGTLRLEGIPPTGWGLPKIAIEFSVDETCSVTARASVKGSPLSAERTFDPPSDLSDTLIAKLLAEAESSQAADEAEIRRVEAFNRAKNLIAKAEGRLKLGPNSKLNAAIAALGLGLNSRDSDSIREKSDTLDSILSPTSAFFSDDLFSNFFGTGATHQAGSKAASRTVTPTKRSPAPKAGQGLTSSPHPPVLGKIFGGGTFTLDSQLCFVLMPFADRFQPIYEDHIRPTVERAGLRCKRADDVRGTSLITWDIWEHINRARFLLAELTDQNANVFYELGLAHALSKDVVLLTQSMDWVPFDLKPLRCICYEFTPRGIQKFEQQLGTTIAALMKIG